MENKLKNEKDIKSCRNYKRKLTLFYLATHIIGSTVLISVMQIVQALEPYNLVFHSTGNPSTVMHLDCLVYKMILIQLNNSVSSISGRL